MGQRLCAALLMQHRKRRWRGLPVSAMRRWNNRRLRRTRFRSSQALPGDLERVFATMLEKAVQICDAKFGNIYRWNGAAFFVVAAHNTPPAFAEERRRSPHPANPETLVGRMTATRAAFISPMLRQSGLTRSEAIRTSLQLWSWRTCARFWPFQC